MGNRLTGRMGYTSSRGKGGCRLQLPLPSDVQISHEYGSKVHFVADKSFGNADDFSDECFTEENKLSLPLDGAVSAYPPHCFAGGVGGILEAAGIRPRRGRVELRRWSQAQSLVRPLEVEVPRESIESQLLSGERRRWR